MQERGTQGVTLQNKNSCVGGGVATTYREACAHGANSRDQRIGCEDKSECAGGTEHFVCVWWKYSRLMGLYVMCREF